MSTDKTPEVPDILARVMDFAATTKDFVDRLSTAPELPASSGLVRQFRSVLEANAAVTRVPMDQLRSIASNVEQQRTQIAQMKQQLQSFDDQLKTLSDALQPMLEWGEQWTSAQDMLLSRLPGVRADDK